MKAKQITIIGGLTVLLFSHRAWAQQSDSVWPLQWCISQAMSRNIQVQQASLGVDKSQETTLPAKAARYPSLSASAGHNYSLLKSLNMQNQYGDYANTNVANYGVSSSVTIFNGFKTKYTIEQAQLGVDASSFNAQLTREDMRLSVLDAYLQVLYAEEALQNNVRQLNQTTQQLQLAAERLQLGVIAKSDYLQVRSQQASEQSAVARAQKTMAMSRVLLLQLMEMPVNTSFKVERPNIDSLLAQNVVSNSDSVFAQSVMIKPSVKLAQVNVLQSEKAVQIARADYYPRLSLTGQLTSGYSSALTGLAYDYQVQNRLTPLVGLSLVIPIYQNRVVKSSVARAQIDVKIASLSAQYAKNQLRKSIEQACVDVKAAQESYNASNQEYLATNEALLVATEKFSVGMLNSVDFLIQKNRFITAESNLLQAKYNLIFSYKTLEFYLN